MKKVVCVLSLVLFSYPAFTFAQVSTTSPHQIGFFCPPYTEFFVEGSFYQFPTTTQGCTWNVGDIPPGNPLQTHYGGFFRGLVGSSTSPGGNFMGKFTEQVLTRYPIDPSPVQGEPFFAAIWEVRNFPVGQFDLTQFLDFFRTGSNLPPTGNWGVLNFKWGEAPPTRPDPVIIIPGILGSQEHNGTWEIDPILHTYDDLIATLDVNHYTPEVDLFTFPYDWRRSNVETAALLKDKIDQVKLTCDCDKVDLVAHSMGGLAARYYIQSDEYEDDVDQLIFLGTPHLGAPKAYLMWEGGETGPFLKISDTIMELILNQEALAQGYQDLFTYIQNKPISAVQELLPIYDYLFDDSTIRQYPVGYPSNTFLLELNNDIDQFMNSNVRVSNFVGETGTQKTLTGLQIINTDEYTPKWEDGYPVDYYDLLGDHGLLLGPGDETVPIASASHIDSNLSTIPYSHSALPTGAEGDVYHILTGQTAAILSHNFDSLSKKILHVLIHSPADLLVITPDGKRIGKDPQTNLEIDEIPNAFYTGFTTDTEFITILNPLDGEYKIFNQGIESGAYTVEVAYVSNEETTETSFTGNTMPGLITELNVAIDNQNPGVIEIVSVDTEPPIITITSPEVRDYLHSGQISVNVSATDTESGVYALETILGTTTIPNTGTIDLFFKKLGIHTLTASSTDNVGNATTSNRSFRIIATPDSTLSDIERAYTLGWISKSVRDNLTKKLNAAIKVSKVIEKWVGNRPNGEKVQKTVDKILTSAILIELQKLRGKGLNDQAYQLLKEDIQWLINN